MPSYPQQTFNTFDELLAYINTNWVQNGVGDITGVIGNNVVNGELTFIRQSPLNWAKAKMVASTGAVSLSKPITIFYNSLPASVTWGDNIYNEWVLINTTANDIPLLSGTFYYDLTFTQKTTIPAGSVITICKSENNLWLQINNTNGSGNGFVFGVNDTLAVANRSFDFNDFNFAFLNVPAAADTLTSAIGLDEDGNLVYGEVSSGGGSQTWQETLTVGSVLTGNNTIDGGGFDLVFNDIALTVSGSLTYVDGNETDGYVLTSDGSGLATWQPGGISPENTITWSVLSIQNSPPGGAVAGDIYLVGTSPTGVFVGHANEIATFGGVSYTFQSATTGDLLYNAGTDRVYQWTGTLWKLLGKASIHQGLDAFGSPMKVGTSDNKNFGLWTNNTLRLTVSNAGAFTFATLTGAATGFMSLTTAGLAANGQFSTGLTLTTGNLTVNLSTGVSGGQTAIGGTAVGDGLTFKSTTANGTSTAAGFLFKGGNNGATTLGYIQNNGTQFWTLGTMVSGTPLQAHTGAFPATVSATSTAIDYQISSPGNPTPNTIRGFNLDITNAGALLSGAVTAIRSAILVATSANDAYSGAGARSFSAAAAGASTGLNMGAYFNTSSAALNIGTVSIATLPALNGTCIGAFITGNIISGTGKQIGAYICNNQTTPTFNESAGLIVDAASNTGEAIQLWKNSGVTVASLIKATTTPTIRMYLGGATTPTALLHLAGGGVSTGEAQFKLTAGGLLATTEAGAIENNGTNLFYTATDAGTRQNILASTAVNVVSPTSPNRTISINIGGTTYFLAAKTTND